MPSSCVSRSVAGRDAWASRPGKTIESCVRRLRSSARRRRGATRAASARHRDGTIGEQPHDERVTDRPSARTPPGRATRPRLATASSSGAVSASRTASLATLVRASPTSASRTVTRASLAAFDALHSAATRRSVMPTSTGPRSRRPSASSASSSAVSRLELCAAVVGERRDRGRRRVGAAGARADDLQVHRRRRSARLRRRAPRRSSSALQRRQPEHAATSAGAAPRRHLVPQVRVVRRRGVVTGVAVRRHRAVHASGGFT